MKRGCWWCSYMVLVHEPVCMYMCDVLCPFERNCDLMLLLADVQDTCTSLPVLVYLLLQAITKSTICSIDCSWLLCVLPIADFFSNKEMRTLSRIRAHQSTRETINTSLWKRKTKPASFNDFGAVVRAPNKICGAFPWRVSVFSVL